LVLRGTLPGGEGEKGGKGKRGNGKVNEGEGQGGREGEGSWNRAADWLRPALMGRNQIDT